MPVTIRQVNLLEVNHIIIVGFVHEIYNSPNHITGLMYGGFVATELGQQVDALL